MKLINFLSAVTIGAFMINAANSFASETLTPSQRTQLYVEGKITTQDGKTWNVLYLPGTQKIKGIHEKSLKEAMELISEMAKPEFWKAIADNYKDAKRELKSSTHSFRTDLLETWNQLKIDLKKIPKGSFGEKPAKAYIVTKAAAEGAATSVGYGFEVSFITIQVNAETAISVVGTPALAGAEAVIGGYLIPGVLYVWNGAAWVATNFTSQQVPENESLLVRLDTENNGTNPRQLVIDKKGFDSILMGIILMEQNRAQNEKLNEVIEAKRKELEDEYKNRQDLNNRFYEDPEYMAYRKLLDEVYSSDQVEFNAETKELALNDEQLDNLIKEYLTKLNVKPEEQSPERVASLREKIKAQVALLQKKLQQHPVTLN